MTGPAQLWYLRLEVNSGASPWQSFVRIVQNHFGPPMTDTPLGTLELLQRTTTVEDYCGKFMALGSIPPKSVAMIWCGLSWELRTDIVGFWPTDAMLPVGGPPHTVGRN